MIRTAVPAADDQGGSGDEAGAVQTPPHCPPGPAGRRSGRRFRWLRRTRTRIRALVGLAAVVLLCAALGFPSTRGAVVRFGYGAAYRIQSGWYFLRLGASPPVPFNGFEVLVVSGDQSAVDPLGRPAVRPSLDAQGEWVAGCAAVALDRMSAATGLDDLPATPPRIVVYPNAEEMARSWGWPAGRGAHGAYWPGAVQVVAPAAWLDCEPEGLSSHAAPTLLCVVGHELTHWAFEAASCGRIPRWLSEGLAQRTEERLLGSEAPADLVRSRVRAVGWAPVDQFSRWFSVRRSDPAEERRAYLLSRSIVTYLDGELPGGWEQRLAAAARQSFSFAAAFARATGMTMSDLECRWREWVWR